MSMLSLYQKMRSYALQDPILRGLMNGSLSWEDTYTAAEEERYQEYCRGEGAAILDAVRKEMPTPVPAPQAPFFAPMEIKTTTILLNPNHIKTSVARNLPRDATQQELRVIFEPFGPVRDLYIPKNTDPSSPYFGTVKGFALIKYLSPTDSTRAFVALETRLSLRGKQISLEFAREDK